MSHYGKQAITTSTDNSDPQTIEFDLFGIQTSKISSELINLSIEYFIIQFEYFIIQCLAFGSSCSA